MTLKEKVWREVMRRAEREGVSGAAWIRRAIAERLEREK